MIILKHTTIKAEFSPKDKAENICSKTCGDDYCPLYNEGDKCPKGFNYFCDECNVGFKSKGEPNKVKCPYCKTIMTPDNAGENNWC
jgi:hypothetical protein